MKFNWREVTAFRLLAVFLAIILWIYVTHQRNPVMERAASVNLKQQGLAADMIIEEIPSAITIYYKSSMGRLALVNANEFEARVNLSGVGRGTHSLPVRVTGPEGVEVVRVNPQRVTVTLDRIIEKNIPVTVNILGAPAPGYKRLEPIVTPPVLEAKGPSHVLNEIDRIAVSVDIRGTPTGIEQVLPVTTGLTDVELNPNSVKVNVPVEPLPSRAIEVQPAINGTPANGFRVESVIVNPNSVEVTGDKNLLDSLNNVKTEGVNITGADGEVTKTVKVIFPEGISSVEPGEVDVTVKFAQDTEQGETDGAAEAAPLGE